MSLSSSLALGSRASAVFCDYLRVSFHPEEHPLDEVEMWLLEHGFFCSSSPDGSSSLEVAQWVFPMLPDPVGLIRLERRKSYALVSLSGAILAHLRQHRLLEAFCSELASHPHKVTRLDATLDFFADGAVVMSELRDSLAGFSDFPLYRNRLPLTYFLSPRESDGRETGTLYFGYRSRARITARIYDKQAQLASRGLVSPPVVRVEITRCEGATLRDACLPDAIFWDVAQSIITPPDFVEDWVPVDFLPRKESRPELLPYQVLSRGVDADLHLAKLIAYADSVPNGRIILRNLLERALIRSVSPEGDVVQDEAGRMAS